MRILRRKKYCVFYFSGGPFDNMEETKIIKSYPISVKIPNEAGKHLYELDPKSIKYHKQDNYYTAIYNYRG